MDKLIQPVALNLSRFKAEYKRLSEMSVYARAMDRAIEIKANKWMDYTPLSKMQLLDDLQPAIVTVRVPIHAGNGVRRSTFRGAVYAQATVIWRPTELMAIARALGFPILDMDLLFERYMLVREVRYCFKCKHSKDVSQFAHNRHYPGGFDFWCKDCKKDMERGVWRIAS